MRPLAQFGYQWTVPTCLVDELEEPTSAFYGQSRFSYVDEPRFKNKCENKAADASRSIDPALLPPCIKALGQHIKRANFQKGI